MSSAERQERLKWFRRKVWLRRILWVEVAIIGFEMATRIGQLVRGYPSIGGEIVMPIGAFLIWWMMLTSKRDTVRDKIARRK